VLFQSPNSGLLSLTGDTWTTKSGKCFMSITGHWIGASIECPNEWQLHSAQLGFAEVDGHHSGANLAQIVVRVIDRYDARQKVCHIFICFDDCLLYSTLSARLDHHRQRNEHGLYGEIHWDDHRPKRSYAGRTWSASHSVGIIFTVPIHTLSAAYSCMEHAVHLASKHFAETVAPTPAHTLLKKLRAALKKASRGVGELDLDDLDAEFDELLSSEDEVDVSANDALSNGEDIVEEVLVGDVLGKALALVKQV
jgi:hypothetical protein